MGFKHQKQKQKQQKQKKQNQNPNQNENENPNDNQNQIIRIIIIQTFMWVIIFGLSVLGFTTPANAENENNIVSQNDAEEIAVVINNNNQVKNLTQKEVSDIFLARRRAFPLSGAATFVLEQQRDCKLRADFFRLLNKMSIKQINAYWARLQFSGEVQPPEFLPNSKAVLDVVSRNPNGIGYVDARSVDDSVRAILHLKIKP